MFYSNTDKNRETAQQLICYYYPFSQITRLKKADEQTNFLSWQYSIGHFTCVRLIGADDHPYKLCCAVV